jgi:hypothetical protein
MQVASRLARWGIDFLGPRPLSASGLMNPGGLGGSTGGIGSEFGPQEIPPVDLTFLSQPADATVNTPILSTTGGSIIVQESAGGQVIPGTLITLQAIDNNGATVQLSCPSGCIDREADDSGVVNFGTPTLNKTEAIDSWRRLSSRSAGDHRECGNLEQVQRPAVSGGTVSPAEGQGGSARSRPRRLLSNP